jgi:predicted murein hydrolase (TIGR00659 family)
VSLHIGPAWEGLVRSPLLGITLTLGAYQAARWLWRRSNGHSLANPVLVSIVLVAGFLLLTRVDYADYLRGGQYIAFLLGPATVALALPLYSQADRIRRSAPMITLAVLAGSLTAITVGILATRLTGGTRELALSMAPKSATTPVSIAVSQTTGGISALTAVFTILTGVLGAVAAPAVLTLLRVQDERVRGLAVGVVSHGIGTARLLADEPAAGAFAALAMAINALVTAVAVPLLLNAVPALLSG